MISNYTIKLHAKERMAERSISERVIKEALQNPTNILYDDKDRLMVKKLYKKRGKERLLLIAGEMAKNRFEIITVIDTSKVKKYL